MKITLLLAAVLYISAAYTCPSYKCATEDFPVSQGNCQEFYEDLNQVSLQACNGFSNTYCPHRDAKSSQFEGYEYLFPVQCTTPPLLYTPRYPNEKCNSGTDCLSGTCSKGVCVGLEEGQECLFTDYCNAGLFCNSQNICVPLGQEGEECTSEYECQNNMGCHLGKCQKYFSLPDKTAIDYCFENKNDLCETGTCAYSNWHKEYLCTSPFESVAKIPQQCTQDLDCVAKNDDHFATYTRCECGLNPTGTSFCTLSYGDQYGFQYLKGIQDLMGRDDILECHSIRRKHFACYESIKGPFIQRVKHSSYRFFNYPQLQEIDECAKATLFPQDFEGGDESVWLTLLKTVFALFA